MFHQKGTKAPQAAGKIHTDFEKGFIMAEVMKFSDFKEEGSESAVKVCFYVDKVTAEDLEKTFPKQYLNIFPVSTGCWQIPATRKELHRGRWRHHLFQIQYTQCTKKETISQHFKERINSQ